MARTISIRRSLLWNLMLIVVVLCASIMAVTLVANNKIVATFSESIIRQTLDQTRERLDHFFDPVADELRVAQAWGEAGMFDFDDPAAIRRLFAPMMRRHEQVTSVIIAREDGREVMLLRLGERWRLRLTPPHETKPVTVQWLEWTDSEPVATSREELLKYTPFERPWYIGAMRKRRERQPDDEPAIHWTQPYTFATTKQPGITAAMTYDGPEDATHVVAFDVLLDDITTYTMNLAVQEHGMALVMTARDHALVGLPPLEQFNDPQARQAALLRQPEELGTPLAIDATRAFEARTEKGQTIRFDSEGAPWWGAAELLHVAPDCVFIIVVIVPESDLTDTLVQMRWAIAAILLTVLIGGIWRAIRMADHFSDPIESLVHESDRISRGDLDPGEPIHTDVKEVLRLAGAHDRMRAGLRSLMKIEDDLQLAQQIQKRTFPDHLPRIEGYSIDARSDPAEQTGGDSYDVIGCGRDADGEFVFSIDEADTAVLLLADATGHGIGPALSVSQVRAMLRMAVRLEQTLGDIVEHMNEQLHADLPEGRFITAWLGLLNAKTHELISFSAGQGPLLLYESAKGACRVMFADTFPMGISPQMDQPVSEPVKMAPGDIFAVISDGVFEAKNEAGEEFGADRVMQVIHEHRDAATSSILEAVWRATDTFIGSRLPEDDRTAIIIKREH